MRQVDVVLNIFAKPYQTAVSLLTLLKYSERHINAIHLQFEPSGSRYDTAPPYAIAWYLQELGINLEIFQPEIWIECDAVDETRLTDTSYRQALRYQRAFECTDRDYLFYMHNDVLIKRDIIGAMLEGIGDAFAIGSLGQCWNCPASNSLLMREAGLGDEACGPERYEQFKPDFSDLERLYALARARGVFVRPYWEGWQKHYANMAWPLPECRVNEWGCLVNMAKTRHLTKPFGMALPFGAYEYCGSVTLDIDVAWFRDLHRLGLRARHFPLDNYLKHWVGSFRMTREMHMTAELEAQEILLKAFPDFVAWCKKTRQNLF